jgi:hypothetical protein
VSENFSNTEATAYKAIEAWEEWCRKIGMPTNLKELGVTPTDAQIEEMAEKCVATGNGHVGFFQTLYKEDVIKIFEMAR